MTLLLRDYLIYKDMYNPDSADRKELLQIGRQGQDAFLLLSLALEARARGLGKLTTDLARARKMKMLGWPTDYKSLPRLPSPRLRLHKR